MPYDTKTNLNPIREIDGNVHQVEHNDVYLSKHYNVWKYDMKRDHFETLFALDTSYLCKSISRIECLNRMSRLGILDLKKINKEKFICFALRNFWEARRGHYVRRIHKIKKGFRPLIYTVKDSILYYGEYFNNYSRIPVKIWQGDLGKNLWKPLRAIKNVKHIHFVSYDPYENRFFVGSGDEENESYIWRTRDFRVMEVVGGGGQMWRTICPLFTKKYIYWGTDLGYLTPSHSKNYIVRMERFSRQIEAIAETDGPIYYSTRLGRRKIFTSAVEGGKNEWDDNVSLWVLDANDRVRRFILGEKDRFPRIFRYGEARLPHISNSDYLWINFVAITGKHGRSFCYNIADL